MTLDLEQLEQLVDEAYELSWAPEMEIREEYSGRAMYGDTVPAIVADTDVRPELFYAAGVLGIDFEDVPKRIDSMGLGVVIY